jgi:glycerol kinase
VTDGLLAIDQGTTGSRAFLFTLDGSIAASAYQELPQHFPQPGWVEHDPEEIWSGVAATVEKVLADAPEIRVRTIGITNQRETVIVWDRSTGRPLGRAIVWQDRRTTDLCRRLSETGFASRIRRATGLVIDPYFSGTKLRWLLDHDATLRRAARAGRIAAGTVDSWILWRLTGGTAHATDFTNASRTLLLDIDRRSWSPELLATLRVPEAMLPTVHPSAHVFGETAGHAVGLPSGIPIAGIAGDQQAALYGQRCLRAGEAKNTYGTGCFFLVNAGRARPRAPRGLLTTLACDVYGRPCYALEGSVFIAGAAVQWLRDGLGLIASAEESEALAQSVPDTEGVVLVPAFAGLGAPHWDPEARGILTGLTRGTTRAHVARAALEAMAYQSADIVRLASAAPGVRVRALKADGGAAANDFLLQFQADVLGRPVVRPRCVESTALGAALLAGVGIGLREELEPLRLLAAPERTFKPAISARARRQVLERWTRAVAQARAHGFRAPHA